MAKVIDERDDPAMVSDRYQASKQLIADFSHELRTPLSVIKGYSELLAESDVSALSDDQTRFCQLIVDRIRDVTQMVDDLLDTSRFQDGSLRVERGPCEITALFMALHRIIDSRVAANMINWIENIEQPLPLVYADAEKMCRVLANLAVHAIKRSPEESRIVLSAKCNEQGDINISMTDEAPGYSPENLALFIEPANLVRRSHRNIKGLSLGLNIAKELISLNLGQLNASSDLEKGSTLSFILPRNRPDAIIARLLIHLEKQNMPPGWFAILRVTPAKLVDSCAELMRMLTCSSYPNDVLMPAMDGKSIILFGYSTSPEGWRRRLEKLSQKTEFGQKLCGYDTEMAGALDYPASLQDVVGMVVEQHKGIPLLV